MQRVQSQQCYQVYGRRAGTLVCPKNSVAISGMWIGPSVGRRPGAWFTRHPGSWLPHLKAAAGCAQSMEAPPRVGGAIRTAVRSRPNSWVHQRCDRSDVGKQSCSCLPAESHPASALEGRHRVAGHEARAQCPDIRSPRSPPWQGRERHLVDCRRWEWGTLLARLRGAGLEWDGIQVASPRSGTHHSCHPVYSPEHSPISCRIPLVGAFLFSEGKGMSPVHQPYQKK